MADEIKNDHADEEIEEKEGKGAEGTGSNDSDKGSEGKEGDKKSEGKTFTQDQVNRMMTREKNQGRNAAYKEMGIDPKDEKTVKMFKAFIESQKTDEQKAKEKESENQTKMNEAEQRANAAEAKVEAMMLGVKPQYVDDAVALALAKLTDDSDMKTIIGEFKIKYPIWFGESEKDNDKDKGKTGKKGTGSSIKSSDKDKNDKEGTKSLGARLAAQRKTGNKKSSYWGK